MASKNRAQTAVLEGESRLDYKCNNNYTVVENNFTEHEKFRGYKAVSKAVRDCSEM